MLVRVVRGHGGEWAFPAAVSCHVLAWWVAPTRRSFGALQHTVLCSFLSSWVHLH